MLAEPIQLVNALMKRGSGAEVPVEEDDVKY